jgi:hypothetical protein
MMSPVAIVAYYQILDTLKGVEASYWWLLIGWIYLWAAGQRNSVASLGRRSLFLSARIVGTDWHHHAFPLTPIQLDL